MNIEFKNEGGTKNQWLMFLGLGFMNTAVGILFITIDIIPVFASLAILLAAALFFIAAILKHKET